MADLFRVMVIGAHPDDCEIKNAGMASKWIADGHAVCFCSVTDGRSGHHIHQPDELAALRKKEAQAAAEVIGAESIILGEPDGYLMPSLEARAKMITAIRGFNPDLIITHRPNDYHPDHRYTSQLVQDAAFTVQVPHIIPDAPAMKHNPVIVYMSDHFQKPHAFNPDVVVEIDSVQEQYFDVVHEHKSQFYEWIPHVSGYTEPIPGDDTERRQWIEGYLHERLTAPTALYADKLRERYGDRTADVRFSEAFEGCEYGSPLDQTQIQRFFGAY